MRKRLAAILLLFLAPAVVLAEEIQYEIYEISRIGSKLVASGKRDYSVKDVELHPYSSQGRDVVEKLVELERGYRIGARILVEKELLGFGLIAQKSEEDFSWNWYNRESVNRYKQLFGGTLVDVTIYGRPFKEELIEVRFLDDAVLRFKAAGAREDTHRILVKAGSVLRLK